LHPPVVALAQLLPLPRRKRGGHKHRPAALSTNDPTVGLGLGCCCLECCGCCAVQRLLFRVLAVTVCCLLFCACTSCICFGMHSSICISPTLIRASFSLIFMHQCMAVRAIYPYCVFSSMYEQFSLLTLVVVGAQGEKYKTQMCEHWQRCNNTSCPF
jgi:hypothetical protein